MVHLARYRCNPSPRLILILSLTILIFFALSITTDIRFQDGSVAVRLREHLSLHPLSQSEDEAQEKPVEGEKTTVYAFDPKNDIIIKSRRNPSGNGNRIDCTGLDPRLYNPAIIELPAGGKYDFMIIARLGHVDVKIGDRDYKRARQAAFFANLETDASGEPVIRRVGDWNRTILVGDAYPGPEHKCESEEIIDKYIGPEDAKLYWTRSGAPLLLFTHQVPYDGECQGIFMIDARAAVPELVEAFGAAAKSLPPVEVSKPRQLRRPAQAVNETSWINRFEREKNWVPFQRPRLAGDSNDTEAAGLDELFFHVQPETPRVYRFVRGQKYVASVADSAQPQTCLEDVWTEGVHQGTPMLSLTLCRRGECEPDRHNTIFVGLVQKRRKEPFFWYDGRVVTWNATAPYEFRSISKRVIYQGTKEGQYNWNCGLIYHRNTTGLAEDRSHGYLDDEMWVTYGVTDWEAGWVDVRPEDLLKDHTTCPQK